MSKTIPWFGLPFNMGELSESLRIISSNQNISNFESAFAQKMGAEYAYSTFSARTALYLILKALDLNRNDEVIVPSFVCPAVLDALLTAQVKPVLVDIDPVSYTMDIDHLNKAISPKTKAMIPVHTYGHPCDMDALCEIARDKGIYVIEDCAPAAGAEYNKRLVGSFGDISYYSFNIDKHIVAGSGGMILTDNKYIAGAISNKLDLLDKCTWADGLWIKRRFLRSLLIRKRMLLKTGKQAYSITKQLIKLGRPRRKEVWKKIPIPLKRISPVAAGLGLIQLKKLDENNKKRIENAKELTKALEKIQFLQLPMIKQNVKHTFLYYTIKIKGDSAQETRDKIIRELNGYGIHATNFVWPLAIHQMPRFRDSLNLQNEKFPWTDDFVDRFINLPVYPLLGKSDMKYMTDALSSIKL